VPRTYSLALIGVHNRFGARKEVSVKQTYMDETIRFTNN
jgi:hypothetical protein